MPEENKEIAIDYVMEKASGPHFSGLRLDGLLSPSSSPRAPTLSPSSSFALPADPTKQPFVIGVSGGTASGKTTVCDMIIQQLHDHRVVLVNQDSFYRGLTPEELKRVHEYNFDHPDAFDTEQLLECIEKLKSGQSVQVPIYDFKTHQRCSDSFRQMLKAKSTHLQWRFALMCCFKLFMFLAICGIFALGIGGGIIFHKYKVLAFPISL